MRVVQIAYKPFGCTKCSTRFKTEKNIQRHMEQQHKEKPEIYQCWFCKQIYQNKSNYKVHWRKTHENEYLCYLEPEKVIAVGMCLQREEIVRTKQMQHLLIPHFTCFAVQSSSEQPFAPKTKKSVGKEHKMVCKMMSHRTYSNPYNKPAFVISTLSRSTMVNRYLI